MNKSVKKCCICNNKQIGEFITIEDKKYHLCCIEQLQENYKAVLKQRDDTNKSAVETIEKYQHNWNELKRVLNGLLEDENDFYSVMRIRDLLKIIKQLEEGGNNE